MLPLLKLHVSVVPPTAKLVYQHLHAYIAIKIPIYRMVGVIPDVLRKLQLFQTPKQTNVSLAIKVV